MSDAKRLTILMAAMCLFWLGYIWISGEVQFGQGLIGGTWTMYLLSLIADGRRMKVKVA